MFDDLVNMWLDASREPPLGNWTVCRSVGEAMLLLQTGHVNYASLEYYFGECWDCVEKRGYKVPVSVATCKHMPTGLDLVHWMAETDTWPCHRPIVHSVKEKERETMELVIKRSFSKR